MNINKCKNITVNKTMMKEEGGGGRGGAEERRIKKELTRLRKVSPKKSQLS